MPGFRVLNDRQLRRQARRDVRGPSLALVRQINREAEAGSRNISGIASSLAGQLGGYQGKLGDIYGRERTALEGYQQQGQQSLGTAGSNIGGDLAKALALSGQAPGDFNTDLSRVTGGFRERGTAELGALAQRQAAAEEWGAKLPELARLAGLQGVQERAAAARQATSRVQAEIPSQVAALLREGRNRNFQAGAANLAYEGDVYSQQQQTARTRISQRGQNYRANVRAELTRQANNELERHNQRMEAIDQTTEAGRRAADRERERHNRVTENITKRRDRWKRRHPTAGRGGSSGGGSGYGNP